MQGLIKRNPICINSNDLVSLKNWLRETDNKGLKEIVLTNIMALGVPSINIFYTGGLFEHFYYIDGFLVTELLSYSYGMKYISSEREEIRLLDSHIKRCIDKNSYKEILSYINENYWPFIFETNIDAIPEECLYPLFILIQSTLFDKYPGFPSSVLNRIYSNSPRGDIDEKINTLFDEKNAIRIYRGVTSLSKEGKNGYSWSLDVGTAANYACKNGYEGQILMGIVTRENVLDVFLENNESEILVAPGKVQLVKPVKQISLLDLSPELLESNVYEHYARTENIIKDKMKNIRMEFGFKTQLFLSLIILEKIDEEMLEKMYNVLVYGVIMTTLKSDTIEIKRAVGERYYDWIKRAGICPYEDGEIDDEILGELLLLLMEEKDKERFGGNSIQLRESVQVLSEVIQDAKRLVSGLGEGFSIEYSNELLLLSREIHDVLL